jgi:hypothetical protein
MKTLSIGDIHGKDCWKKITHNSYDEYRDWKTAVNHGATPDSDYWRDYPFMQADRIIFVGDYVDSFDISSVEILHNLKEIIEFKKVLGDRVVLLLGNHDIQYIFKGHGCSGYRPEMQHDLYQLFRENRELFQAAYQIGNTLWTHAGVTYGWLKEMRKEMFNTVRSKKISDVAEDRTYTLADEIQFAWDLDLDSLYNVDGSSGGTSMWAGPFWVRPKTLNGNFLAGTTQIVGHTAKPGIEMVEIDTKKPTKHYYIDCLDTEHEGLLLEV